MAQELGQQSQKLIDDFCEAMKVERNASSHTIRAYHTDLEDYFRWAERNEVDPLNTTHRQVRGYLSELDRARYARTSINRHLSSLRSFYRWLTVSGISDIDPVSVLQGPKQNKHLPHVIRPKDMTRLLSVHASHDFYGNAREQTASDMRDLAILEFLYACGARVSEVASLKLKDVDFPSGQVKVLGKGNKERIIPLHDMALQSMRTYLRLSRPKLLKGKTSEFFFVSTRGNGMTPDAIRKMFKETVREAGLNESLSPHDMRHTFATDLLSGGADLRSVQEMLGHASLSTTQIYTHLSPERLKKVHYQAHPRG